MRPGLLFIHIPKAAGTSLREVIARHYPPDVQLATEAPITLTAEQRRRVRVLVGHVPFGTQEQLAAPVEVITMLRHPVDRVVSLYYYVRCRPHHPLGPYVHGRSLEWFASCGLSQVSNDQVRQMGGGDTLSLEVATRNLITGTAAFGLAERFDESLVLMQQALGWRHVHHRRLNVTDRPPVRELPRAALARIERENALDMELHAVAHAELAVRIERQGEPFVQALRRLRRLNPAYAAVSSQLRAGAGVLPTPIRHALRRALAVFRQ
jgi:hypothetical protein